MIRLLQRLRVAITWPGRRLHVRRLHIGVIAGVGIALSTLAQVLALERPSLIVIIVFAASGVLLVGAALMERPNRKGHAAPVSPHQPDDDSDGSVLPEPGVVVRLAHQGLPRVPPLIGRDQDRERLRQALAAEDASLVVLRGISGVGKTALAVRVAQELEGDPFDAVIWTSAKDHPLTLADLFDRIAQACGLPYLLSLRLSPEDRRQGVLKVLGGKRCLLVVDNFETVADPEVFQFLSVLPERTVALITSRYWQDHEDAHVIELEGLDQQATSQLLQRRGQILGVSFHESDEPRLKELYSLTNGVPKAIQWSVALIKDANSIGWALDRLRTGTGDLFDKLFRQLWDGLESTDHRVLEGMATLAAGGSRACLAHLASVSDERLHGSVQRLRRASMLDRLEGRNADDELLPSYTLHPLTRAYVIQRLEPRPSRRQELYLQRASYFLNFGNQFGGDIEQERWDHFDRLDSERDNLLAVLTWCAEEAAELHRKLLRDLALYLFISGRWNDLSSQCWSAVENLVGIRTPQAVAEIRLQVDTETAGQLGWLLRCIGRVLTNQDSYQESRIVLDQASVFAHQADDRIELAYISFHLGELAFRQRDLDQAEQWWKRSLEISRQEERDHYITGVTYWLGILAYARNQLDEANRMLVGNLAICQQLDWTRLCAYHLGYLGEIARRQQRYKDARSYLDQALQLVESRDPRRRAVVGLSFAKLEQATGDLPAARRWLEQAEEQLTLLGMARERTEAAELAKVLDAAT